MEIRNEQGARIAYEIIRELQTELQTGVPMMGRLKRHIIRLKKEVRAFNRSQLAKIGERRIIKDDGMDGYVELVRLPVRVQTIEGAKDYFEQYEVRECIPSAYDCTGQAFTNWFKVFARGGRMWAYHSVSFDV